MLDVSFAGFVCLNLISTRPLEDANKKRGGEETPRAAAKGDKQQTERGEGKDTAAAPAAAVGAAGATPVAAGAPTADTPRCAAAASAAAADRKSAEGPPGAPR